MLLADLEILLTDVSLGVAKVKRYLNGEREELDLKFKNLCRRFKPGLNERVTKFLDLYDEANALVTDNSPYITESQTSGNAPFFGVGLINPVINLNDHIHKSPTYTVLSHLEIDQLGKRDRDIAIKLQHYNIKLNNLARVIRDEVLAKNDEIPTFEGLDATSLSRNGFGILMKSVSLESKYENKLLEEKLGITPQFGYPIMEISSVKINHDIYTRINYPTKSGIATVVNKYDTLTNTESQFIVPVYLDWTELKDFRQDATYVNPNEMIRLGNRPLLSDSRRSIPQAEPIDSDFGL